jgi:hypothetical protein
VVVQAGCSWDLWKVIKALAFDMWQNTAGGFVMINQVIWRTLRFLFVAAFAIFVMPLSGFAGDVETIFDYRVGASSTPFFSSLKIAPDGKTAWAGTAQAILRFTGSKRDEFRRESLAAFAESSCYNFKPLGSGYHAEMRSRPLPRMTAAHGSS